MADPTAEPANAPRSTPLRVLLVEQAARTSNESDLYRAMSDSHLTVLSNRGGWRADREIIVPAFSPPFLGGHEAWTAVPAWFRGLPQLEVGEVDVVTSLEMFSFSSMQASLLARRLGVPHAITVAETMADNPLYRLPPWSVITKMLRHRIDLFICLTSRARDHLIQLGCPPDRCQVLHLGVDTEEFHPAPQLVKKPIVLFVGMFRANRGADKGVLEVVEACRRLARTTVPDIELRLVGDGHLRPELEAMAAEEDFLTVYPRHPREEIPSFMRDARVLVLGSKRTFKWEEQFGFVLVEAMASGLPVVATTSGAIPEVVPDWNPLVAEGHVADMAEGIHKALGPDGEKWGAANRVAALDRYEVGAQGKKLRQMLSELCGSAHEHTPVPTPVRQPLHLAQPGEGKLRAG